MTTCFAAQEQFLQICILGFMPQGSKVSL